MRFRIPGIVTMGYVADSRQYDEALAAHAREALRTWMADKGLNQKEICRRVGFDPSSVSRVLNRSYNQQPGASLLIAMRRVMGRSIDDLLGLPPLNATERRLDQLEGVIQELKAQLPKAAPGEDEKSSVRDVPAAVRKGGRR